MILLAVVVASPFLLERLLNDHCHEADLFSNQKPYQKVALSFVVSPLLLKSFFKGSFRVRV